MKLAVAVGTFPQIAESWVIGQVCGLLDRGHEVRVVTKSLGPRPSHELVEQRGLMDLVSVRPRRGLATGVPGKGLGYQLGLALRAGGLSQMNPFRHGRHALSGRVLFHSLGWIEARERLGGIDAVVAHHAWHGWEACKARRAGAFDAPIATWFHGSDVSAEDPHQFGRLFRDGDLFIAVSAFVARKLAALGCDPARTVVMPMGIRAGLFTGLGVERGRSGDGAMRVVSVGRLVPWKGTRYAIEAVAALVGEGADVEYDVVGDGEDRAALEGVAESLGVGERVRFHGALTAEGVRAALDRADVFVMPSVRTSDQEEAMPVAPMEAGAAGLPVVATDIGGLPEVVEDGVTGVLTPERDAVALASALRGMLDPAVRARMGSVARERCVARFGIDGLLGALESRLEELVAGYSGRSA